MVNVEWGTESSRMEEADSMRRHSPTKPIVVGSTASTSRLPKLLEGGRRTLRLPFT